MPVHGPLAEYIISTPAQFWSELEETLGLPVTATLEEIDLALKTFVYFCAHYYNEFVDASNLGNAVQLLLDSPFYTVHSDRMVNLVMLLVETRQSHDPIDSTAKLHVLLHILLQNGYQKPPFLQILIEILNRTEEEAHASGEDSSVEGLIGLEATELLYETLRVKRLTKEELPLFEEKFISHLFEIVEQTRDGDEHYNYALIRLIIALNEQFMVVGLERSHHHHNALPDTPLTDVSSTTSPQDPAPGNASANGHHRKKSPGSDANLVLKILRNSLHESKTFGENLIFILNRLNGGGRVSTPEDLCVSLLILKILYLLFSTASTCEYFYTNDLRVLVDVFIRELLDLPEESEGLRHTYLRVLHPLMTHTQLRAYPYKREAIRATLLALLSNDHIKAVSPTTRRLVERNLKAEWCLALAPPPDTAKEIDAEAQLAKKISAIALKGPAAGLRVETTRSNTGQSTLSVNEVAESSLHYGAKAGTLHRLDQDGLPSQQGVDGNGHIGHHHHHHHSTSPTSASSLSLPKIIRHESSSENLCRPKKSRVPPPRPPKPHKAANIKGSQSLPATPPETSTEEVCTIPSITGRFRRAPPPTPSRSRRAAEIHSSE